jgi:UDP-glucose 4-epimerase
MTLDGISCLVTGAGGFIGSHLCEALVSEGAHVRALCRYSSTASIGNLALLPESVRAEIEVVFGNVRDAEQMAEMMRGQAVVFHLASLIGIPYSYEAPRSYVETIMGGTLNVLEAARRLKTLRIVHVSTSEVYGSAQAVPMDERHPLHPQSPYAACKVAADQLALSYHRSFGLPVVVLRPFNSYGPRQSPRAIVPSLVVQLLRGDDPILVGNTAPRRDLLYVTDTVRALIAAATHSEAIGQTVHVGTGAAISIGSLATVLVQMVRPGTRIEARNERRRVEGSEVLELVCDPRYAEQVLGWRPLMGLTEGLERTVAFLRSHPERWTAGYAR